MPVYCLKSPYSAAQGCSQWWQVNSQPLYLSRFWDRISWGADAKTGASLGPELTVQDMADILRADPYVTQTLVADNYQVDPTTYQPENPYTNPCHPGYGIGFDPNDAETLPDSSKFLPPFSGSSWPVNYCAITAQGPQMSRFDDEKQSIQFPAPQTNGQPTTYTGNIQRGVVSTYDQAATETHTHAVNVNTVTSLVRRSSEVYWTSKCGIQFRPTPEYQCHSESW